MTSNSHRHCIRLAIAAALILAVALVISCGQSYNSHSSDDLLVASKPAAGECDGEAAARRCAALTVLQSKCYSCHGDWAAYKTDDDWKNSGKVSANNTAGSVVYSRTINAGGDMPLGGTALSAGDFQALQQWILLM